MLSDYLKNQKKNLLHIIVLNLLFFWLAIMNILMYYQNGMGDVVEFWKQVFSVLVSAMMLTASIAFLADVLEIRKANEWLNVLGVFSVLIMALAQAVNMIEDMIVSFEIIIQPQFIGSAVWSAIIIIGVIVTIFILVILRNKR